MNSIIEAQIELNNQIFLEIERCKDPIYYFENYFTWKDEKGNIRKPTKSMIENAKYFWSKRSSRIKLRRN